MPPGADLPPHFFFCIGPPKTGTTLLARLVDEHPDIACLFESYALYPDSPSSLFHSKSDKWKHHGFERRELDQWAQAWLRHSASVTRTDDWQGLQRARELTFQEALPSALTQFARRCGAVSVGDKWCWYISSLDVVRRVFPRAKFIYTVRDPRAVWNSGQQFRSRKRGDSVLAEQLAQDKRISPSLSGSEFLTVRYEDLVLRSEATLEKIHRFLEVRPLHERLQARALNQDPYPRRWDWVPEASQPLAPKHVDKWRIQLSSSEVGRITERAQSFMATYGYAP